MMPEDTIEVARRVIDEADRKMARLFAERMQAVSCIAEYRGERGLPTYDAQREAQMIERNAELVEPALRPYYETFLRGTIAASREYQQDVVSGMQRQVASQGALQAEGAEDGLG